MRTVNEEARRHKQIKMMEKCFDCYAENGLAAVGVKAIADACGCNVASLYQYFDNLDDLIVKSIEYWYCHYPLRNSWNFTAIL